MTLVTLYVIPMLLGRTYDVSRESVGVDIFPQEELEHKLTINRYFTDTKYRMITNTNEARDFLQVQGDLSLKVKAGVVNLEGIGDYLKETTSRSNVVEVLVNVHYETVTETLPSKAKPMDSWMNIDKGMGLGTHYARSITYGGELIAALRFKATNNEDRETIKAKAGATINRLGDLKGEIEKLQHDLKNISQLEISYFATVPIKVVPNNLDSLMELIQAFPQQTKQVNSGLGVPLRMELFPLSSLNNEIDAHIIQIGMTDLLTHLEEDFDDVRAAKKALMDWMEKVPPYIPQNFQNQIGEFNSKLEDLTQVFYRVISNMDLSTYNPAQFKEAFDDYHDTTGDFPDKYYRRFLKLRDEVVSEVKELQPVKNHETYTAWGTSKCLSNETEQLYSGVMAITENTLGGGVDPQCLPKDLSWRDQSDEERDSFSPSLINPIVETLPEDKTLACAVCKVSTRTGLIMVPGEKECPEDWSKEYRGILMASDIKSRKTDAICVEDSREVALPNLDTSGSRPTIAPTLYFCGTLKCGGGDHEKPLPCVVCSH